MENYLLKDLNISPSILASGEEYYNKGLVHLLFEDGLTYKAEVEGQEKYETTITIKDSRVSSFSCTCPYPRLCKHVVALAYVANEKEGNVVHSFAYRIKRTVFTESLEAYKGLPYKINSSKDKLTEKEYVSLMAFYYAEMCRSDYIYDSCSSAMRLEIFTKSISLKENDYEEMISQSLAYLQNDSVFSSRLLSMFLKENVTTEATQSFIIKNIDDKSLHLQQFIIGISGKMLPKKLLPDFTLLLVNYSSRVLTKEDLLLAKKHFEEEDVPDNVLSIMHALLKKNDPSLFDDKDFEYLSKNGLSFEAKIISLSLLKMSDDFSLYIRYRKLFTDKEFYNVRFQVENVIAYKKYLNSVLLFDGKMFFPALYESFSYLKLDPYEVFLAKDLIKDPKDIHILAERAHQYIKGELNKKNREKNYFYYLLYLDYLKDESVSFYLFDDAVLEDKEEGFYRGIWVYLIAKNNFLSRTDYMQYIGENNVSNQRES